MSRMPWGTISMHHRHIPWPLAALSSPSPEPPAASDRQSSSRASATCARGGSGAAHGQADGGWQQ